MCGISLVLENARVNVGSLGNTNSQSNEYSVEDIQTRLKNRGPDAIHTHSIAIGEAANPIKITFIASVLFIRGTSPTPQPYGDDHGNLLLWNGEIFGGVEVKPNESDTRVLFETLVNKGATSTVDVLKRVEGPWAFIFWHAEQQQLWFGRDPLGRRSLVVHSTASSFVLSSIPSFPDQAKSNTHWEEVNTYGLFCINFKTADPHFPKLEIFPRQESSVEVGIGFTSSADDLEDEEEAGNNKKNTTNTENTTTNSIKPETSAHQITYFPFGKRATIESPPDNFITSAEFPGRVQQFMNILSESVGVRVANLPAPSTTHYGSENPTGARLGILFSGGLDSMVLAALSDKHIPQSEPIDLINVSFGDSATSDFDKVPDRQNGINGFYELQKISKRPWNLIKVNITHAELEHACKNSVYFLTYPAITIMDITIGAALWFAAKGKGIIHDSPNPAQLHTCTAKVLVLGMGADEQLAGYGRHRSAFQRGKWEVLQKELEKDFNRIWKRNLGRDDRIVSDSGREARFPYLDENVVKYLNSLPLWDVSLSVLNNAGVLLSTKDMQFRRSTRGRRQEITA